MIGGDQIRPYFAIKYQERKPFLKQPPRRPQQISVQYSPSIEAYNPQPSSRYQSSSLYQRNSSSLDQSRKACTRRRSKLEKKPMFSINKECSRIDIQLFEQNANGGRWEGMKGRVVYRNNTPKNSYYLLSSMKELQQQDQPLLSLSRNYSRDQVQFNSKFESGNAATVMRMSRDQYYVFTREDTNTHGLRQWFYFQAKSSRSMRVHFRVYSFNKHYSLYRKGMKPYVKIDGQWRQAAEDVVYARDPQLNCYFLAFSLAFQEGQRIQVANMPPYTYCHLLRFLSHFQQTHPIKLQTIGCTLGGVDIPSIHIIQQAKSEQRRRAIVIIGRTHPGETCSNFSLQRILDGICESELLRNAYDFFIVPMVNPDGVIVGNHRTSLAGNDLNRRFGGSSPYQQLFPETQAVKNFIKSLKNSHNIEFFFDFHGHSAQSGVFAYAGYEPAGSEHFLKSRIIPKLLSETWHGFSYDSCVFQQVHEKNTTARVHFRSKWNITSITFEQSYGLIGNSLISVTDWRRFGDAFLIALSEYTRLYLDNNEALTKRLQQQIQQQLRLQASRQNEAVSIILTIPQSNKRQQIDSSSNILHCQIEPTMEETESLDSGDEQLEMTQQELNYIQQNMRIKVRQINPRQVYQLNDQTIHYEIQQSTKTESHRSGIHDKLPLISRILRTKGKRKVSVDLIDILTRKQKEPLSQMNSINASLRLPSLPRRQ